MKCAATGRYAPYACTRQGLPARRRWCEIPKRIHSTGESAVRARFFYGTHRQPPTAVLRRHVSDAVHELSLLAARTLFSHIIRSSPCPRRRRQLSFIARPPRILYQIDRPTDASYTVRIPTTRTSHQAVTTTSRRHEMQLAARRIRWMCLLCACALADQHVNTASNDTQTGSTSVPSVRGGIAPAVRQILPCLTLCPPFLMRRMSLVGQCHAQRVYANCSTFP